MSQCIGGKWRGRGGGKKGILIGESRKASPRDLQHSGPAWRRGEEPVMNFSRQERTGKRKVKVHEFTRRGLWQKSKLRGKREKGLSSRLSTEELIRELSERTSILGGKKRKKNIYRPGRKIISVKVGRRIGERGNRAHHPSQKGPKKEVKVLCAESESPSRTPKVGKGSRTATTPFETILAGKFNAVSSKSRGNRAGEKTSKGKTSGDFASCSAGEREKGEGKRSIMHTARGAG